MRLARITSDIIWVNASVLARVSRLNELLVKGDYRYHHSLSTEVLTIIQELFVIMQQNDVRNSHVVDLRNTRVNNITFYFDHPLKVNGAMRCFKSIIYVEMDCVPLGQKWTLRLTNEPMT